DPPASSYPGPGKPDRRLVPPGRPARWHRPRFPAGCCLPVRANM
ncbi:MAG: hypothetical protein AVDCRST_MAG59-142, partial [uncultured Thermomicrobiales bacterium]